MKKNIFKILIIRFNKYKLLLSKWKNLIFKRFIFLIILIFKKIVDFIAIIIVFFIIFFSCWYFLWIWNSFFTQSKLENYIKEQIPIDWEYKSEKFFVDLKWYWVKDLIILIKSYKDYSNTKDVDEQQLWDKLIIFSKKEKNPLYNFIYSWELYEKELLLEFKYNNNYPNYKWLNYVFNEIVPFKNKSEYTVKSDILIDIVGDSTEAYSHYYWLIKYDFDWYSIKPLFSDSYNCKDSTDCTNWIGNLDFDSFINWKKKIISLSQIISPPTYIDINNLPLIYFYNYYNNLEEWNNLYEIWEYSYLKNKCTLDDYWYNCISWWNSNIIKKWTTEFIDLTERMKFDIFSNTYY